MAAPGASLRGWLERFRGSAPSPLTGEDLRRFLQGFPHACRDALVQGPEILEEWRTWLASPGGEAFVRTCTSQDEYLRRWLATWLDTFLDATQAVHSSARWTDRSYPRELPAEIRDRWRGRWGSDPAPDLPEPFWHDLVRFILGTRPEARPPSSCAFPIVPRVGLRVGIVVRWEVEPVAGLEGGEVVFPDPAQVLLRPMRPDFLESVREVGEAAGRLPVAVRFRVTPVDPRDEAYLHTAALEGSSGGGALYVALRALLDKLAPEPGLAVSFAVRGRAPEPVGELERKAGVCSQQGFGRLVVAEEFSPPSDVQLEVVRVRSLAEAEQRALGLAREVGAYLDRLQGNLDRTPWSDPDGNLISVTRIAVPPVVLKKVPRRQRPPGRESPGQQERETCSGPATLEIRSALSVHGLPRILGSLHAR